MSTETECETWVGPGTEAYHAGEIGENLARVWDAVASAPGRIRAGDVAVLAGVSAKDVRSYLRRLVDRGSIVRHARGIYEAG